MSFHAYLARSEKTMFRLIMNAVLYLVDCVSDCQVKTVIVVIDRNSILKNGTSRKTAIVKVGGIVVLVNSLISEGFINY